MRILQFIRDGEYGSSGTIVVLSHDLINPNSGLEESIFKS